MIPAYRAAGFIDRAIRSALGQRGVAVEVIVVDDACPLDTAQCVRAAFGERDDLQVLRLARQRRPVGGAHRGLSRRARRVDRGARRRRRLRRRTPGAARRTRPHARCRRRRRRPAVPRRRQRQDRRAEPEVDHRAARHRRLRPRRSRPSGHRRAGLRPAQADVQGRLRPAAAAAVPARHPPRRGLPLLLRAAARRGAVFLVVPTAGYLWTLRNSGQSQDEGRLPWPGRPRPRCGTRCATATRVSRACWRPARSRSPTSITATSTRRPASAAVTSRRPPCACGTGRCCSTGCAPSSDACGAPSGAETPGEPERRRERQRAVSDRGFDFGREMRARYAVPARHLVFGIACEFGEPVTQRGRAPARSRETWNKGALC
ncbi:MAG: glycosyltransferase [Comamonadaceae bacterium]|nr:glycosyltransferase [Comamonadaceae bacterium]